MPYIAQVIADNSGKWCGNALEFDTAELAETYATDLAMRWTLVRDWRVMWKCPQCGQIIKTDEKCNC